MSNAGVIPGDVIYSDANAPGLCMVQPTSNGLGHPLILQGTAAYGENAAHLAISPDNSKVALMRSSGSPNVLVFPMDGTSGASSPAIPPPSTAYNLAWSADSSRLCIVSLGSPYVTQYNAADLSKITDFVSPPPAYCQSAAYSPDGTLLAVGSNASPYLVIYNLTTGEKLANPSPLPSLLPTGLQFTPDGSTLIVGVSGTNTQYRYNVATWVGTALAGGSFSGTKRVRVSPGGARVAIFSTNSPYLRVYETATWTLLTNPAGLDAAAAAGGDWIDDRLFVLKQTLTRVLDYNGATGTILRTMPGLGGATSLRVRRGGTYRKFAGTVTRQSDGAPLVRKVRVLDRLSGRQLGETVSAADGTFTINCVSPNPAIAYAVGDGSEVTKIFDSVTAVLV